MELNLCYCTTFTHYCMTAHCTKAHAPVDRFFMGLYFGTSPTRHYSTRLTTKSPVRQQNAWFDTKKNRFNTKMAGSTQKYLTQQAPVDIAIIKHRPPFLKKLYSNFCFKDPIIHELKKFHCHNGEAAGPFVARVSQCTQQELRNSS